jgi:hypothetical protein
MPVEVQIRSNLVTKVVLIFGYASPLVLRPVGPHYELVIECYVHGTFHGEVMRGSLKKE